MWAASIATAAGVHTLDVWRYLIPAVPVVGLMLSLFVVELAETIACLRREKSRITNADFLVTHGGLHQHLAPLEYEGAFSGQR